EPRVAVPVYGPASVLQRVIAVEDRGQEDNFAGTLRYQAEAGGGAVTMGGFSVRFADMYNAVPCVGSRWEAGGGARCCTGQTGPGGNWREAARGVELMLSEASYQEWNKNPEYAMHLRGAEAGEIAREVGARKLVFTHIPPYLDSALSVHEAE